MKEDKQKSKNIFGKAWHLPKARRAREAVHAFSKFEKIVFFIIVAVFVVSALALLWKVNNSFLVTVPAHGGTLQEGVVGTPRFINPLLAISQADEDLTSLVYSGLMKENPDGTLVPDLAESYTVSPDGLTYTFTLKNDIYFQDGTPITADDVVFTVARAQDPELKSPKFVNWDGVTVQAISPTEVKFTLQQPYAPFLENTTLGILPKHIWQNISADEFAFSNYNIEPVGSGPYEVKSLKRDSGGIPVYYRLEPFKRYASGTPYISNLIVKFYSDEDSMLDAYKSGDIESMAGVSPDALASLGGSADVRTAELPRVFGIFFNQSEQPIFADKTVRTALNDALDKQAIVDSVLDGYGTAIDGPVPPGSIPGATSTDEINPGTTTPEERIAQAKAELADDGWKPGSDGVLVKTSSGDTERLAFSISTSDAPELKAAANMAATEWKELGADVTVHIYDLSDLNENVIRARKYDALLFGQVIGPGLDFYPFWHSSERLDPGLNVAEYANTSVDELLEDERSSTSTSERVSDIDQFDQDIKNDMPAVFLYSPKFVYVLPSDIQGAEFGEISSPEDRFNTISSWYIETNKIWKIFASQK